ncbi:alpha/beta hydrolase [Candidatus Binatus sp.]|uniref:alpha/beta hydrolase n=1 Tax=Candidatus Binatus sp. TaxID=2811406 RepID=UPI003C746D76
MKISRIISIILALLFIVAVARLTRLENGGPPHAFVMLPGQEPATLYLPGPGYPFYTLFPKPEAQRPPAVVLIHGFTGDRVLMSGLARRLAENGYAVLAIDVNGHGENRNPFSGGAAASDGLRSNIKNAVDYLRDNQLADGSRIVVMGHSMGAGAALDYATHDPSIKGAVMISGGWALGPERPKDALFIFAERDPQEPIQDTSTALAAHLAGVAQIDLGKTYGDFTQGNAVEAIRMPGLDHITIVNSPAAATVIIKWLDSTFGIARTTPIELKDARRGSARFALFIFVILLVPLGRVCGAMAPGGAEDRPGPGAWMGLLILGAALIAAMPLTAADPASFVPVVVGDIQISWFLVAGLIIVGVIALSYPLDRYRMREGVSAAIVIGVAAFAVVYVCQVAMSPMLHHLSLSPERLMVMAMATVLMFPFWMGFEWLVRRGGTAMSTVWASLGRVLILVLMAVGASLNVLPGVLMLILPILAIAFVMIEIFSASAYSTSRNLTLIAVVEALWFAWLIAAASPITFMF